MSRLFSPLTIKDITFRNRIAVSPMCQYSSEDGFTNDWHLVHLGSRAVGGAGLVLVEATAVSAEGRITPDDVGIWKDAHIANLQRITAFLEAEGAVPGVQLAHAGRKASHQSPWKGGAAIAPSDEKGWQTVAPSALPFTAGEPIPTALDEAGIQKVIDDFRGAAQRSLAAGFKVIEIHAAHGYLLHEFYSPLSNQRTDAYGGSFENRIRLLVEVVAAVQEVWPAQYPLFVRISATDWTEGGWTGDDSVQLGKVLKEKGVDLIDCSTGGNVPNAKIPVGPLYQASFAEKVNREAGIMTGAVGMITSAAEAEALVAEGKADLVLLAREMLRDPYFPLHAALELGADIPWPVQYERAKPRR
ncbi:NADH:flavin oxidoreductase/NADH oxidase [Pontibacter sp. E15-1]|uniref:NADH:flavin oxidoreductase/NADH oxidase n=1 Tax=Pontibacter sp. E15-1 TaxID=2919918 RepID=UPI001F4F2092|nr:NADH:flavin oxidoreductase/NADH oxidase [Pontibacter sp. E15-1]MCJ8163437.1 NADH:flavin oxidoreductase/NADH oxidase [Pontibacter sp. E15-1]